MSDITERFETLRPDLEKFKAKLPPAKAGRFQITYAGTAGVVHLTCGRTHHQTFVSSNHDRIRSLRVMHRVAQFAEALTRRLRESSLLDHDKLAWSLGFVAPDAPRLTFRIDEMKTHSNPITLKGLERVLDTLPARLPTSRSNAAEATLYRVDKRLIGARSARDALALWHILEKAGDTSARPANFHPLWDPKCDLRDQVMSA